MERPTGLAEPAERPEPEPAREWAPDALMAGSPCFGWERPSSLAVGPKAEPQKGEPVRWWGRTESSVPALAWTGNG